MNEITFEQLTELVEKAIIIIAFIAVYRSIPAEKVAELRQKTGEAADKTTTPIDNLLLQIFDAIDSLRPRANTEAETPHNPAESRD